MLSSRIKELRLNNDMTMLQLSKLLNIGESTISLYESGKRQPSYDILNKMSELFNCSIDYLLGKTDDPTPPGERLFVPDELKDVRVAFHRGEFEDLNQDEVNKLAEYARFIKTQREATRDDDN